MLNIFRKIRQKLLQQNAAKRYLLYAFGEILLVVIGILIALQVNNWNEEKKNLKTITDTIHKLETELLINYEEANFVLGFWNMQDSFSKQVIFNQVTIDDYRKNDLMSIVTGNWYAYSPILENLNLLLENEKFANERLEPILSAAKSLQNRGEYLDQQWRVLRNNIEENIKTITREVSLVRLDSLSKERKYEYLLTNPDYKQLVELNWIHFQNYYDFVSRSRAQAIALLSIIKVVQEEYGMEELENLYASLGMSPFKTLDCQQETFERNDELRRSYLIGNLSSEEVNLTLINDGKVGSSYKLLPNQFSSTRPEYAGLDGDYTVIAVQSDSNGNCIAKFIAVNKGYLIIN